MGHLKQAVNQTAYCKIGMYGFEGSGKTRTAAEIMIGLAKYLKTKKPLAFFDTETGSDAVLELFERNKIKLVVAKTRSIVDLCEIIQEAEKECYGLIIDSLTHVWRDLTESYQRKLKRTKLQFQDWNKIKPEWHKYADKYTNSKVHIVVCGRAGWDYNYFEDEDGKKELEKTSTKMKAEGEFSFEPSLVIEMERSPAKKGTVGTKWVRTAHILKDRFDQLDGQSFDNPTFENFLPFFKMLNIGGDHFGIDTTRTSEGLFDDQGDTSWSKVKKQRTILLEEIEGELTARYPGHSGKDKVAKIALIEFLFKTKSWEKISGMDVDYLKDRLGILRDTLNDEEALLKALNPETNEEQVPEWMEKD